MQIAFLNYLVLIIRMHLSEQVKVSVSKASVMPVGAAPLVYLDFSVKVVVLSFVLPLLVLWIAAAGPVES